MFVYLRTELMKLRKDRAFLWALAGFTGGPAMVTAMFLLSKADLLKRGAFTMTFFAQQSFLMTAILMAPMMLAVLGTHLITSEYRQKTLKGLLPLPMSLPGMVAAKAFWGVAGIGVGLLAALGVTVAVPWLLGAAPGSLGFAGLLLIMLKKSGMLLMLFAAQLFFTVIVSLISRNFVVPLAAAAFTLVGGLLAISSDKAVYVWTSLPMLIVASERTPEAIGQILATGALYSVVFLAFGLLCARFMPNPE